MLQNKCHCFLLFEYPILRQIISSYPSITSTSLKLEEIFLPLPKEPFFPPILSTHVSRKGSGEVFEFCCYIVIIYSFIIAKHLLF